jgi:hypothetical protein
MWQNETVFSRVGRKWLGRRGFVKFDNVAVETTWRTQDVEVESVAA